LKLRRANIYSLRLHGEYCIGNPQQVCCSTQPCQPGPLSHLHLHHRVRIRSTCGVAQRKPVGIRCLSPAVTEAGGGAGGARWWWGSRRCVRRWITADDGSGSGAQLRLGFGGLVDFLLTTIEEIGGRRLAQRWVTARLGGEVAGAPPRPWVDGRQGWWCDTGIEPENGVAEEERQR
jgi:hypothetical protein